jgi:phosphoribosylformylglycinamidine (FGAM) synthase PurS component
MGRVVIDVMPKPEILDPQGKAVAGALARLGFGSSRPPGRASGSSSRSRAT